MLRGAICLALVLGSVLAARAEGDMRALSERYVALAPVQSMLDASFGPGIVGPMLDAMGGDKLTAQQREQVMQIVLEELQRGRPAVEKAMAEAAAENFTAAELEALIAFYGSELGAAIMGKMQPFMQSYLSKVSVDMQKMQAAIDGRVGRELAK